MGEPVVQRPGELHEPQREQPGNNDAARHGLRERDNRRDDHCHRM